MISASHVRGDLALGHLEKKFAAKNDSGEKGLGGEGGGGVRQCAVSAFLNYERR